MEGRMVQGTHHQYVLTTATADERDDWVEALQKESPSQPIDFAKYKVSPCVGDRRTNSLNAGRSPRSGIFDNRPLAEGWLRRRSDVNHTWQRRYFMVVPLDKKRQSGSGKLGLFYYTTQEMGNRMMDLGVSTEQGVIPLPSVKKIRVVAPGDPKTYNPPGPSATVLELVTDKAIELISPECEAHNSISNVQYWLDALSPHIQGGNGININNLNNNSSNLTSPNLPTGSSLMA